MKIIIWVLAAVFVLSLFHNPSFTVARFVRVCATFPVYGTYEWLLSVELDRNRLDNVVDIGAALKMACNRSLACHIVLVHHVTRGLTL